MHFPNEDPIGRRIELKMDLSSGPAPAGGIPTSHRATIVGIVPNVRQANFDDVEPDPVAYVPFRTDPRQFMNLMARTDGDPTPIIAVLREEVRALWTDIGFNPSNVQLVKVWLGAAYEIAEARHLQFQRELLQRSDALGHSSLAAQPPFALTTYGATLPDGRRVWAKNNNVSGEYFRMLGIPVLQGRSFELGDGPDVVVVNQAFVSAYLPAGDPVGRAIVAGPGPARRIIGVVGDTWTGNALVSLGTVGGRVTAPQFAVKQPATYGHVLTSAWRASPVWLLVRSGGSVANLRTELEKLVTDLDPSLAPEVTTLDVELATLRKPLRFYAMLLTTIGSIALVIAVLGVGASAYHASSSRAREIAVRVALGSSPLNVVALMLKRTIAVLGIALLLGGVLGTLSANALRVVLFAIEPLDWISIAVASALLTTLTIFAAYIPVRQYATLEPAATLRESN
jgi:hypothetical protein